MERYSIPGVAKTAIAAALPATLLFGCLFYGAGPGEGENKGGSTNQPSAQLRSDTDTSANDARRHEAQTDSRALVGILKGMGAGAGP